MGRFVLLLLALSSAAAEYSTPSAACSANENAALPVGKCHDEYLICSAGYEQPGICPDGQVFYGGKCVAREESPECNNYADDDEYFDCSDKADGTYSVGCVDRFVSCVGGSAFTMNCPEGLVYVESQKTCLRSCEDVTSTTSTELPTTSTTAGSDNGYQPAEEDDETPYFDCTGRDDGFYTNGACDNVYFHCSNEKTFPRRCPETLVFNFHNEQCDYNCDAPSTTTTTTTTTTSTTTAAYETVASTVATTTFNPVTDADVPSTQYPGFNCSQLADGVYAAEICSPDFFHCANGVAFAKRCPSNLVFNSIQKLCDYECGSVPTTTSAPVTRPTTTEAPYTAAPGYGYQYTTPAQDPVCTSGAVRTFGKCLASFERCRNGQVQKMQCPAKTVFDTKFLLCLYNSDQCKPVSYPTSTTTTSAPAQSPTTSPIYNGPPAYTHPFFVPNRPLDTGYSPVAYGPSPFARGHGYGVRVNDLFYSKKHRHHHRHHHRHRVAHVYDDFDGVRSKYISTNVFDIFPMSYGKRRQYRRGPGRRVPDSFVDDDDTEQEPDILEAATATANDEGTVEKLNTLLDDSDAVDGSGSGEEVVTRKRRSYTYGQEPARSPYQPTKNWCSGVVGRAFIALGQCRQDFVFCNGETRKLAACPIGELFDASPLRCVASSRCGSTGSPAPTVPANDVPTTVPIYQTTQTPANDGPSYSVYPGNNVAPVPLPTVVSQDQPQSTTSAPVHVCFGRLDGPYAESTCSATYVHCTGGSVERRTCPSGLIFDGSKFVCNYREQVAECSSPQQDQPSYSTDASPTVEMTPGTTLGPYGQPVASDSPPAVTISEICKDVSDGVHGIDCASAYVICQSGSVASRTNCGRDEGFSSTKKACAPLDRIQGCDTGLLRPLPSIPLASLTSTLATTTVADDAVPQEYTHPASDSTTGYAYIATSTGSSEYAADESTTQGYGTTVAEYTTEGYESVTSTGTAYSAENSVTDAYEQPESTNGYQSQETTTAYNSDDSTDEYSNGGYVGEESTTPANDEEQEETGCKTGSTASLGSCLRRYLKCNDDNEFVNAICSNGQVFDESRQLCIAKKKCGKKVLDEIVVVASSTSAPTSDGRCATAAENATRQLGVCRSSFVRCSHGKSLVEYCSSPQVYSSAYGKCVAREQLPECHHAVRSPYRAPSSSPYEAAADADTFCGRRVDGLYKDPNSCSGIVQCFGGDAFHYPSCPSSLAFNERSGHCDYSNNVLGCAADAEDEGSCGEHGSFLASDEDCSTFFRCVWGRRVKMPCPAGTVFNPLLSVCDWPSAVSSCSTTSHYYSPPSSPY